MFFTYVARELRRRRRQAVVVAIGLALGVGLVVTVSAMSDGVGAAQRSVLHSLYGVGTDITVTQTAAAGSGGGARFGLNPANRSQQGEKFSRDQILQSPGYSTMTAEQLERLSNLPGVRQYAGGLSLIAIHLEGKFTAAPESGSVASGGPGAVPSVAPVKVSSYSIEGVDVTRRGVGALTPGQITSGRYFAASETDAKVAIADRSYARQHKLRVGSKVIIAGTAYTVVGIATTPSGGDASNLYIPLARAQKLAGLRGKVNRIYVKATSASTIDRVKAEIQKALPKATVTTASDLASQVSGSLASASNLSSNLGTWLSVAALIAAFAVASLLTVSAVGRRVREFGTLKALGWRTRRVVGQVMGETIVQGILGGILGIGVGVGGAFLVTKLFPSLKATLGSTATGGTGGPPGGPIGQAIQAASRTVAVPLRAPISASLLLLAIGLALAGGVMAGLFGGWRAARLRPAEALRRVE